MILSYPIDYSSINFLVYFHARGLIKWYLEMNYKVIKTCLYESLQGLIIGKMSTEQISERIIVIAYKHKLLEEVT